MVTPNGRETKSNWMADVTMPQCQDLRDDLTTDVCIIGAGLGGLLSAFLLMKAGRKVCVLEESRMGAGQSGRTTAQFSFALDHLYCNLEKMHGPEIIREVFRSHRHAIEKTFEIIQTEHIDCGMEFVDGFLFRSVESSIEILETEFDALLRAGADDIELKRRGPYSFFHTGPVIYFPKQLQLHPLMYMKGLAQLILLGGGKIYENSPVVKIEGEEPTLITTKNNAVVTADYTVIATHSPVIPGLSVHPKQAPYRTYVIAAEIPKGSVPRCLLWDTEEPLHYVRVEAKPLESGSRGVLERPESFNDLLLVGGEDHKTGTSRQPEDCFKNLEQWMRQRFPMATNIVNRWSGQIMESVDGLALLGKNPGRDRVFIITGDSGNGMTSCAIGALLISDLIAGRANPWTDIYSPARYTLRAAGQFFKENKDVIQNLARRLLLIDEGSYRDMPSNSGVVMSHLGKKVAVYKDAAGDFHTFSAVCPHMGCTVSWNSVEKSWDCPCHGSRFDCEGQVIEGPAVSNIKKVDWKF